MGKKVFVGLSGGVDSAVSAALLKRDGHDVTGVFIKIWQPTFLECTWERDRLDAMRIAVALGIPFREIDLSSEYEKEVISDMTSAYAAGLTPNPDVVCNEKIKFGHFYEWARQNGADLVATGHYARTTFVGDARALFRGADPEKDQSYFLHRISVDALEHVMFPIGDLLKAEVRELARRFGLPVAAKRDSQGLCFVGDVSMRDFLSRYIEIRPGNVRDHSGLIVGRHHGAALYTIGQRHGFEIIDSAAQSVAHYVVAVDAGNNELTVSTIAFDAGVDRVHLEDLHVLGTIPTTTLSAQSRYRERPFAVSVETCGKTAKVAFQKAHVVSRGQSLVLYDGDRCIGGGTISGACA